MSVMRSIAWATTATVHSIGLPATLVAAVLAISDAAGVTDLGTPTWPIPLLFVAVGVAHEVGHAVTVHAVGGSIEAVGSSLGSPHVQIAFVAATPSRVAMVLAAGPMAAFVFGVLTAVVAGEPLIGFVVLVIGVGHLVSLLAPIGDGAELRQLRRETRARSRCPRQQPERQVGQVANSPLTLQLPD